MNTNDKIEDIHNNINDKVPEQIQSASLQFNMDSTEDFTRMKIGSEQVMEVAPLAIFIKDDQLPKILCKDLPIKYNIYTRDRELQIYRPDNERLSIDMRDYYYGEGLVIGEQAMSVTLSDLIIEYLEYFTGKLNGKPKLFYGSEDFEPELVKSKKAYSINVNKIKYSSPMEGNYCLDYKKIKEISTKDLPQNIKFNFENAEYLWGKDAKPTVMFENMGDRVKIIIIESSTVWDYTLTWENYLNYFIIKHDMILNNNILDDPKFLLFRTRHPLTKFSGDFIYEFYQNHDSISQVHNQACRNTHTFHNEITRAGERSLRELQRVFWITNKSDRLINTVNEITIPHNSSGAYCKVDSEKRFGHICL